MMTNIRDPVHCISQDGLKRKNGITLRSFIPENLAEIIALFPAPFKMREQYLKVLEQKGWGKIKIIKFGTLCNFPNIKNGYINVFIQNLNYNMTGGQVNILGIGCLLQHLTTDTCPCATFAKQEGMKLMNANTLEEK